MGAVNAGQPGGDMIEIVQRPAALGSLERGIELLDCLSSQARPMSLTQLSRATGLPKTTTHRLLSVLERRGLIRRSGGDYVLVGRRMPFSRRLVLPHLVRLYEATRQTVNLAVLRGIEAHYVERIYGENRVRSRSDGIDRAPLHCTAVGKVLLAFSVDLRGAAFRGPLQRMTGRTIIRPDLLDQELKTVRRDGVAYSREEFVDGVVCAAAPLFGPDGEVRMAIGVAAPAAGVPLGKLGGAVRHAADQMALALLKSR